MVDFFEGQYVVYPAHGVGVIKGIETQEIAGTQIKVLVISFSKDKMVVRLPLNKSTGKKVRKLCSKDVMKEALECLRTPARSKKMMWSRRAQEYENKINSGNPVAIAEVIRDLSRSENLAEQSYSERQIYEQAVERLASEVSVYNNCTMEEANAKLNDILAKERVAQ